MSTLTIDDIAYMQTFLLEPEVALLDMTHDLCDAAIKLAVHRAGAVTANDIGRIDPASTTVKFTDPDAITEAVRYIREKVPAPFQTTPAYLTTGSTVTPLETTFTWTHTTKSGREVTCYVSLVLV